MKNQKVVYDRGGLGYNSLRKQKLLKNMFIGPMSKKYSVTYFKCNNIWHKFLIAI